MTLEYWSPSFPYSMCAQKKRVLSTTVNKGVNITKSNKAVRRVKDDKLVDTAPPPSSLLFVVLS